MTYTYAYEITNRPAPIGQTLARVTRKGSLWALGSRVEFSAVSENGGAEAGRKAYIRKLSRKAGYTR